MLIIFCLISFNLKFWFLFIAKVHNKVPAAEKNMCLWIVVGVFFWNDAGRIYTNNIYILKSPKDHMFWGGSLPFFFWDRNESRLIFSVSSDGHTFWAYSMLMVCCILQHWKGTNGVNSVQWDPPPMVWKQAQNHTVTYSDIFLNRNCWYPHFLGKPCFFFCWLKRNPLVSFLGGLDSHLVIPMILLDFAIFC